MHSFKRFCDTIFLSGCTLTILTLCSCKQTSRNQGQSGISKESILAGKKLASIHCQSCHLLPDPSLLNSKTWEQGVLPRMGPLLGIGEFHYKRYPANYNDRNLQKGFYPEQPLMKMSEWEDLVNYYIATAPDSLVVPASNIPVSGHLAPFTPRLPVFRYDAPTTGVVRIDPTARDRIITADLFTKTLFRFDKDLQFIDSSQSSGEVVDLVTEGGKLMSCNMGIFNPTNERYGEVRQINVDKTGKLRKADTPLLDKLRRPVNIAVADLNNDGKNDYVVCEFGYLVGALSWFENLGGGTFQRHELRSLPGATKVYIQDYNKDGLQDLWVLFAQGDEGVFLFTNNGNGSFESKQVLRFPPAYGSSYFELADFNKDGRPDIVYTCGDNADYSTILKPYHGVYIFINEGANHFKQEYFFHLDGCYKAIARDFDNDGDLDIATISFFADFARHPEEGFVYLNNTGSLRFTASALNETKAGRWINMEAGDIDGDGKTDLIMGNFSHAPTTRHSTVDWKKGPPFLVLMNNSK